MWTGPTWTPRGAASVGVWVATNAFGACWWGGVRSCAVKEMGWGSQVDRTDTSVGLCRTLHSFSIIDTDKQPFVRGQTDANALLIG